MQNPIFGFMGGVAEFVPEGKMMITDEVTGQPREVTWTNHMRFTIGRKVYKMRKPELVAIADLMKNKEFREVVESCP